MCHSNMETQRHHQQSNLRFLTALYPDQYDNHNPFEDWNKKLEVSASDFIKGEDPHGMDVKGSQ